MPENTSACRFAPLIAQIAATTRAWNITGMGDETPRTSPLTWLNTADLPPEVPACGPLLGPASRPSFRTRLRLNKCTYHRSSSVSFPPVPACTPGSPAGAQLERTKDILLGTEKYR